MLVSGCLNSRDLKHSDYAGQTVYFAVEINGILCGYAIEHNYFDLHDGKIIHCENTDVSIKTTLLGANIDLKMNFMFGTDTATGKTVLIRYSYNTGKGSLESETVIRNDTAFFSQNNQGVIRKIPLGDDIITSSASDYSHLICDFLENNLSEKRYLCYEFVRGEVVERNYIKRGEEEILLNDSLFQAIIVEETDLTSGVTSTLWIDPRDGYNVRTMVAGRDIYLSDKSVLGRIKMVDMNEIMFARVGVNIQNFTDLTWLKVKATINSYGESLTSENLNFRGQRFTGTVTGNLIEGEFELEPARYSGEGAPAFPPDFSTINELDKYLQPEMMIESDDPAIIKEAVNITDGSADSWEAATRLSKWVSENIEGALPGGGTASNTLSGGHSRLLAAFCRAVGIPARLSIGCMYTPYYTGSFGQHAWTEIFMGDAGWIPVDATIGETDYVDAGHIRLGEKSSFQPVKMEILDYKVGNAQYSAK